jgi:Flp pilus assembly protein TadG
MGLGDESGSQRLSFLRRSEGNVASMFALSLVPLIVAGGAALD